MNNAISVIEIQENPCSISISDDDLCSDCKNCLYVPGELSLCTIHFDTGELPGSKDEDGYIESCEQHITISHPEENWALDNLDLPVIISYFFDNNILHLAYSTDPASEQVRDFRDSASRYTTIKTANKPLFSEEDAKAAVEQAIQIKC